MTWRGARLGEEQRDLASVLDALAADRGVDLSDDEPEAIAARRSELVALGIWTLGVAEDAGGGGADPVTTAVALERLGRHWPALGWAVVQAHAALDALGSLGTPEKPASADDPRAQIASGATAAVVDAAAAHVRLSRGDGRIACTVDRVDTTGDAPTLLVLDGVHRALLIPAAAATSEPVRRTGLDGALTRTLAVDVAAEEVLELTGQAVSAARCRLMLGAASLAAGIAGAAADDAHDYARARHQFGGPLTAIPTVRASLLKQAARTSVLDAVALCDTNDVVTATGLAQEACASAIEVATDALQSHGGYGYLTEYPAERRLRDAISLRAATDVDGAAVRAAATLVGLSVESTITKEAS